MKYRIGQKLLLKDLNWFAQNGYYNESVDDSYVHYDWIDTTTFSDTIAKCKLGRIVIEYGNDARIKAFGRIVIITDHQIKDKVDVYKIREYPMAIFLENMFCSSIQKLTELINEI